MSEIVNTAIFLPSQPAAGGGRLGREEGGERRSPSRLQDSLTVQASWTGSFSKLRQSNWNFAVLDYGHRCSFHDQLPKALYSS